MCHGDDDGIILPPKVASSHVVLLPIIRKEADRQNVLEYCERLKKELRENVFAGRKISVEIDDRDIGGARGWDWIKKGIPVRAEIGPRDIAEDSVFMARRDKPHREKTSVKRNVFVSTITDVLNEIQNNLYEKALSFRQNNTVTIDDREKFYQFFTPVNKEKPEIHGGFAMSHWCGSLACEEKIKEDLMVTIRCIPFDSNESENGKCVCCGKDSSKRVVYAKSY
jgi:prolyl-tRNA synthetase